MSPNLTVLHRALLATPVGTIGLWAGVIDCGGHRAVTTHMAVPELLEFILRLASMFAGAVAIFFIFPVAATVMFAVAAMVVFVLTR